MRWRRIMGGCALFAWLAVLPPSGSADLLAAQGGALLQGMLRDPLAILSDRSPGPRGSGALIQSKPHHALAQAPFQPSERVLSEVRDRPANPIAANLDNLPERAMELVSPGSPAGSIPPGSLLPIPAPPGTGLPGSSGGILPPPTGGGGGGTVPPGPPPPPPIVTPVPEPATWLMMIAGVALIGLQLRRRGGAKPVTAA